MRQSFLGPITPAIVHKARKLSTHTGDINTSTGKKAAPVDDFAAHNATPTNNSSGDMNCPNGSPSLLIATNGGVHVAMRNDAHHNIASAIPKRRRYIPPNLRRWLLQV